MKRFLVKVRNLGLIIMAVLIIIGNNVEAKGNGSNYNACNWQHYKTNAFDGDSISCEYLYDNGENAKANICYVTDRGVEYISIERHGDNLLVNEYLSSNGEGVYNEYAR